MAYTFCPDCKSESISQTLLGWIIGEDPNHYTCLSCGWSSHPDCRIGECGRAARLRKEQREPKGAA